MRRTVLVVGLTTTAAPAVAEDCFGGGCSCHDAAIAATDFRLARDCADVLVIAPAKRRGFEKVMAALRARPMAGVGPDQFSEVPKPLPAADCDRIGRAVLSGTPEQRAGLGFLALRPAARRRLQSGG